MKATAPKKEFWKLFSMYAGIAHKRCPRSALYRLWIRLRYYTAWKHYLTHDISPISARIPWIPFECLDYLKTLLRPEFRVFEYGSGGSTLFFAAKTRNVVSVEHNQEWYEQVSRIIRRENLTHCDYRFLPPAKRNGDPSPGLPPFVDYVGSGFQSVEFLDYVRAIEDFPDGHFDLVSVDGRARNSCLFHARPKVKPGGYLLLDNAEREEYSEGKKWMDDWNKTEFYGPGPWGEAFWQAIIWRRPR